MKKLLLSTVFSILFQICYGQSEYVVTVKGDTLYGALKILSYDLVDRVQLTVDKKKKSYTALEVKALFLNKDVYHTIRHDNRYQFMLLLKSGYLSLYGFRVDKQFTYDGRYLVKRDGEAIEVPNIGFKKSMQEFLMDCQAVSDQIKNGEFGKKHLDTLITVYNLCIDQNTKAIALLNKAATTDKGSSPALENLRAKIETSSLSSKQDVLDLIKDLDNKIKNKQAVPNYLMEGLKGYLTNSEYKGDLDRLLETLPKK